MKPLRIVIAPDSFKGSLTAGEAAAAIATGCARSLPDAELRCLPVADGGEGTASTMAMATSGTLHTVAVTGPLGGTVSAVYAVLGDGATAVVEMAEASGLLRLAPDTPKDALRAHTYGVGELLLAAAAHAGVRKIVISLGGSATTDGGAGLLEALGVRFWGEFGGCLSLKSSGAAALPNIATADVSGAERFESLDIEIACDVMNPLLGASGSANVFGPQKGATATQIPILDAGLRRYADALTLATRRDVRDVAGAGAAGGTAAGLLWLFPQAILRPGIDIVLDAVGFDDAVRGADLLFTGEGCFDNQTLQGKAVFGVATRAKRINPAIFVHVIAGDVADRMAETKRLPSIIDSVTPLISPGISVRESMRNARRLLADATEVLTRR